MVGRPFPRVRGRRLPSHIPLLMCIQSKVKSMMMSKRWTRAKIQYPLTPVFFCTSSTLAAERRARSPVYKRYSPIATVSACVRRLGGTLRRGLLESVPNMDTIWALCGKCMAHMEHFVGMYVYRMQDRRAYNARGPVLHDC